MPKVTLNNVVYEAVPFERNNILGLVHVEHIEPFADAFSTTGQTRQERIQSHDSRNFPSPVEGMGVRKILAHNESDPDSYKFFWDSDGVDTRWPSKYTLPREKESVTVTGLERIWASVEFNSALRGLWTDDDAAPDIMSVPYATTPSWLESSGSEIEDGSATALTGLDATVFTNKMVVLFAFGDDHRIEHSVDGTSWTVASTPITTDLFFDSVSANEEIDGGLFTTIAGFLVAVIYDEDSGTGTFFRSPDAAVWTDEALDIPVDGGVKGVGVIIGPDRNDQLISGMENGLWATDVSAGAGSWTVRQIHSMPVHDDNCRRMTVHGGEIWFSQGVGISEPFQIHILSVVNGRWDVRPSRNSPHLLDGVPTDALGTVEMMRSSGGFVYASVGGGAADRNARIICHTGLGWHTVVKHPTANQKITWFDFSSETDGTNRLHYAAKTGANSVAAFQVTLPNTNPTSGVSLTYETTGTLDRPTTDMGMPFISKTIIQYQSNAENLSSTNSDKYIELKDALDGEARGANDRGDFLSGDTDLVIASGAGVASKTITIREVLHNASANTSSPEGVSVEVDFLAQPSEIQRYFLRVDIEATAVETGIDASDVQGNLKTARTSKILVPFSYMNESTVYVDVKVARNDKFDSDSESEALDSQYGTVDLILEEVL